jgi:hypothetical protein
MILELKRRNDKHSFTYYLPSMCKADISTFHNCSNCSDVSGLFPSIFLDMFHKEHRFDTANTYDNSQAYGNG